MQCMQLLHLSLSCLIELRFVCSPEGHRYHPLRQPYTSYELRLPSLGYGLCVERLGFLYCVHSSPDSRQGIHPSSRNQEVSVTLWGGKVYGGRVA